MTRRRWIADEVSGDRAFLTGAHAGHLAQVLRARVGQEFDISTGCEVRRGPIDDPVKLGDILRVEAGARIVLSEMARDLSLKDAIPVGSDPVVLAFGPEGGWKNDELAAFDKAGWISASLGPTILRVETAVIAAVAVCASVLNS